MTIFFINVINKLNKNENYEVSVEAVHHGPYLDKEVMFIELGSNEKDWGNKEEGKLICDMVLQEIDLPSSVEMIIRQQMNKISNDLNIIKRLGKIAQS